MVKTSAFLVWLAILLPTFSEAQERRIVIQVTNPSGLARENETIAIPRDTLMVHLSLRESESLLIRDALTGHEPVSQWVGDELSGIPDEFIFQSSFGPGESKSFLLATTSTAGKTSASFVDARYVEPRNDLAWENDHIAFRVYGPALAAEVNNGIDVWTKRVRSLITKKWYEGEEQTPKISYHVDHGEGADFFSVGRSLGCGGTGIWFRGKVYQPGVFTSYRIVSTGPIRACFQLSYNDWNVEGALLREVKRITLDAGQNLNRIELTFTGTWQDTSITLACGLVKRDGTKFYKNEERGWMSLWGQTNDSLENGYLGTGVVFRPNAITGWAQDSSQYIVLGKAQRGHAFTYYAGAGWTRSGDFTSAGDWNGYLDRCAAGLRSPLQVSITSKK